MPCSIKYVSALSLSFVYRVSSTRVIHLATISEYIFVAFVKELPKIVKTCFFILLDEAPMKNRKLVVPVTSPIVLFLSLLRFVAGNRGSTANHTASGTVGLW